MESYRVSYVTGSTTWARDFDFDGLETFLIRSVGLTPERASTAISQARLHGTVNLPDVSLRESEAPAMGMTQLPSDEG